MTGTHRRAADSANDNSAQSRADRLCAEYVEVGLVMQEMLGTRAAADYLCEKNISIDIATRVLTRPRQRRWRPFVNDGSFEAAPAMVQLSN
ncbi:hypothetical protein [Massilia sp. METH4]|uniref:hypothetical protein n=1 Tax=Massilia sp. METH4 TaxID=3123041 RepID=UPI0030D48BEC